MGRNAFFLVAPSLDRGSLVRGQSYLVMQLDRVYVRKLLVLLVVHALHAPLPARQLSLDFVILCQYQHNFIDVVALVQSSSKDGVSRIAEIHAQCE